MQARSRYPFFNSPPFSPEGTNRKFPELVGEHSAQVAIIGGGVAGVLTAYRLAQKGKKVVIVQRRRIGDLATCQMAGMVCCAGDDPFVSLKRAYGLEFTAEVFQAAQDAYRWLLGVIACEKIDCELRQSPTYLLSFNHHADDLLQMEYELLRVIYPAIELVAGRDLGREGVTSAIRYPDESALNPRMLLYGLLNTSLARQYITVFENSEVTGVTRKGVFTNRGVVYTNDVVLATGCLPEGAFPGFPQVGQKATDIVIAYQYEDRVPPAWRKGNCWTFEADACGVARPIIGEWWCPIDERTIVMGGPVADCPVDRVDDYWPSFAALCEFRGRFLPGQGQVVACWPGACTISIDGLLYAGRINGAYMVEAFNGAGLVGAATGANVVAALITEGTHPKAHHFGFERSREPIGLGARVHQSAAQRMAA